MLKIKIVLFLFFPLLCWGQIPTWQAQSEEEALFLRRIADFWEEEEYSIAKEQMEAFLSSYPESSCSDFLRIALGDLLLREKSYQEALHHYSCISKPETVDKAFFNRMQCLYHLEQFVALAEGCEAFLQKEGGDAEERVQATYFLALSLYRQCLNAMGDSEALIQLAGRARPYFTSLLQGEMSDEVAQALAHLCCILKDYAAAAKIYAELAERNPSAEEEMLFQAGLIQAEYDRELALQTFEKIAQKGAKRAKEAAYNRLVLLFETGHFQDLVLQKEELLSAIPSDQSGSARLFLGRSFLSLGRYTEAASELEAYITKETAPSETLHAALLSLLEASHRAGQLTTLDSALKCLSEYYPKDSALPRGRLLRAQLLQASGNREESRQELEELLAQEGDFAERAETLFELIRLDYQTKSWDACRKEAISFFSKYPNHSLSPHAWRLFASASAEIALITPEAKKQLADDLREVLKKGDFFPSEERSDWQFLLAKTEFDLKNWQSALELLSGEIPSSQKGNALLLIALCYREGKGDLATFCSFAERAIETKADLLDGASLHVSLFNAYLEQNEVDKAADHLFCAFEMGAEIEPDNLFWLAEYSFSQFEKKPEDLFHANRIAPLLEKSLKLKENNSTACKLAKIYTALGYKEQAIALLESLREKDEEAKLLLAEGYVASGREEEALSLFDTIASSATTRSSIFSAAASLQGAQLRIARLYEENPPATDPRWKEVLSQFKDLVLQKHLPNEPFHLEAALEYAALQSKFHPSRSRTIWIKAKHNFEKEDDLLSKDYHHGRARFPQKDTIYQNYMRFMDAEILLAEAALAQGEAQKELQAKAEAFLFQIIGQKAPPMLISRAKQRLELIQVDGDS